MSIPRSIRASYLRGGTSKGVFINAADLPKDRSVWPEIFRRIMGSPCSDRRQLNGMGGGISSLSKICVVQESQQPHTVDFTFAQIGITDGSVDMHGTCGNLMSAVPCFAIEEGLVQPRMENDRQLGVVVHDINTKKDVRTLIAAREGKIDWNDDYHISGVSGPGLRVATEYLNCGGTKTGRLWPTGRVQDTIQIDDQSIVATLIDGPNPAIFCAASAIISHGADLTSLSSNSQLLAKLESVRLKGSVMMGIAMDLEDAKRVQSIPKICLLNPTGATESGLRATTLSMGIPHKAIPITIALSLAIAMATPGTLPHRLATGTRIHHPTGHVDVDAKSEGPFGVTATVVRSVRRLMTGEIYL